MTSLLCKFFVALSFLFFLGRPAYALIEAGFGTTSATSGRLIPSAHAGLHINDWMVSGFSTGVTTDYYYQTTFGVNVYKTLKVGDIFGGEVTGGWGGGLYISQRGFQDLSDTDEETAADFGIGPAFRVQYMFLTPVYISFDATYGLRDVSRHLTLSFQDLIAFSIGMKL